MNHFKKVHCGRIEFISTKHFLAESLDNSINFDYKVNFAYRLFPTHTEDVESRKQVVAQNIFQWPVPILNEFQNGHFETIKARINSELFSIRHSTFFVILSPM